LATSGSGEHESKNANASDGSQVAESEASGLIADVVQAIQEYGSHASYISHVAPKADERTARVTDALLEAFRKFIRREEVEVIDFETQTANDIAEALLAYPVILKPLLALCNIAGRAIERDLDLKNVDTYGASLTRDQANQIAGFVKSFLPPSVSVATLAQIDRNAFFDKEIRAHKGQWEKLVAASLSRLSGLPFKKTKFRNGGQEFELDSAYRMGETVLYGVDVKRIEARRDIHKRADEIANKAAKLKETYPGSKFGAMIYYPFTAEHGNVRDRLAGAQIDSIVFASENADSIDASARLMLGKFGVRIVDEADLD